MSFVYDCITTFNMHSLCYQFISKILSSIYTLEHIVRLEKLPPIFIKPLNVIIIPNI